MEKGKMVEFIHNLIKDVWTDLNQDKIAHYYHKDVKVQFGKQHAEYKDIVHRMEYVKAHYEKIINNIEDVVVENNKVVVRLTQIYQKHNGSEHTYNILAIYQIENNKVTALWSCIDPNINYFE